MLGGQPAYGGGGVISQQGQAANNREKRLKDGGEMLRGGASLLAPQALPKSVNP